MPENMNGAQELSEQEQIRREKLRALQEAGNDPYQIRRFDTDRHSAEIKDHFDELEGKEVTVAGRMMTRRIMGKASFCHIQDLEGTIQVYVARDLIGEEAYAQFKKDDIGDIVGVKGTVFRTKTGELTCSGEGINTSPGPLLELSTVSGDATVTA